MLVREKFDRKWALPGGWADSNLSLKENLIKESEEEVGAIIEPERVIAIFDRKKHNTPPSQENVYKIFVLCKLKEIQFNKNIETLGADFFDFDNLPELSEGRNNIQQIEMCFKSMNNSEVYFDKKKSPDESGLLV